MKHIFNVLKVYKRDMKSILKNFPTTVIIVGLCIIPSLYAWINIKACWNTYENTGTIPVAVVNNDKGASFRGSNLNIGKSIVSNLKKNHKIGWVFVNSKNADMGVIDGSYNAVIEIPPNFTSSFTSITSSNPKKPQIVYKVNTKLNPVSSKITGTAKDTLTNTITTEFISTVNKTIFSSLNEVGNNAQKNKSNILKLKNNIININNNMDFILTSLTSINNNSSNLSTFLTQLQATMPGVNNGLDSIYKSNEDTKNILSETQTTLNNSFNNMDLNLNNASASVYKIQTLVNTLNTNFSSSNSSLIYSNISKLNTELENLNNSTNAVIDFLQKINSTSPNESVTSMIASLKNVQNYISDEKSNLSKLQSQLLSSNNLNQSLVSSLNNDTAAMNTQLINTNKTYNNSAKSALNSTAQSLINATGDAASLIGTAQNLNTEINGLLKTAVDGSNLSGKVSLDLKNRLLQFKDIISTLGNKLEDTNNNDIIQIISVLQNNPDFMGDFISTPFNVKNESIYTIPNYGSGMAPVYTVLAIWVGVLLLGSLLRSKPVHFEGSDGISMREKHFGKMLTFITLSLIQSFIVSVGDLVLLHVHTANPFLLIAFALISGLTFSIIVFSLVSVLGNIGKAVSIVFLIVQIAGSGSTYPIQVDPLFFRVIQPLLPFTYSVGGFREAIAGPLATSVVLDITALMLISTVFILFGFFFKIPLNRIISKFESSFKESGVGE
ncbi:MULTISPECIES: YhgE/Pip domain-containing protein [Clostridium]|uniref:YhgE/Pip domain-containing protein n=1 Tax=Clostridium TaxID=1485 RepID=UPI000825AFB2|nr:MULTISPECIES: YhgE/Pip domain-containing protein [Clostridium]PJI09514.1 YhgE/Pip domain-containing protein [Clostridium sp. CT7]